MTSADLQNKADIGMNIARKWFDVEGVDAIIGMGSSAAALAVQKLAAEKTKITLATTPATAELTGKGLFADRRSLGLRYLRARQRCGGRSGRPGRKELVFHDGRLRLRTSIQQNGQKIVGLLMQVTEIHSLGLKASKDLQFVKAFYWDQNDETREFSKRF